VNGLAYQLSGEPVHLHVKNYRGTHARHYRTIHLVAGLAGTPGSSKRMSKAYCRDKINEPARETVDPTAAWTNRRATEQASRAAHARKNSGRRRFVDPTTSEREYTKAEVEFMLAMKEYKQRSGRMFPTWSEVLEVLRELGYEKVGAGEPASVGVDRRVQASVAAR
jgi:hypothetical protein